MKNIKLKDIINTTKGTLIQGNLELECIEFSKDTRTIKGGEIYIGIKGEKFDGNKFWKEALKKGAEAVIIQDINFEEKELKEFKNKTIIKVENTLEALYKIAKFKRDLYNIPVIAITGSVGKTSTKDIVANVVSKKYKTLKTEGNNNNNIGMPLTILKLKDHEAMVLEMGMNHFGEISLLTNIAKPNICIITNIGTSHIGNLGSRENILKAKLEILEGTENPTVIINNDNDLLHKWYKENKEKYNIKTYGIKNKSEFMAKDIKLNENSSEFKVLISKENKEINTNVPVGGEHFVLNSLCAFTVGKALEIDKKDITSGIESFELTKKRMDIIKLKNGVEVINDAYNASLESMKASLKYLGNIQEKRKIAVLGDMFELGKFSKELHKSVGTEVYKNNIDILICSGESSKEIVKQANIEGLSTESTYYVDNKEEILEKLKSICKDGDVVLFKASNGMQFYKIAEEYQKYVEEN